MCVAKAASSHGSHSGKGGDVWEGKVAGAVRWVLVWHPEQDSCPESCPLPFLL